MLRYLTIFFVLIFNLSQLKATDLSLVKDEIFLNGNQLSYFITNQDVDFKVIKGKKFRFYDKEFVTIQNPNGYYWVKIPIKYDYTRKWIFEIITPQTEKIEFYYPTKKGYQKLELGCLLPFKNRLYNHKNFIVDLYTEVIAPSNRLYDYLEDNKLTWLDDLPSINTLIVKQIKQLKNENDTLVLPKVYKDEDDKDFVKNLFRKTVLNELELSKEYIDKTPNWDVERIAEIDTIILKMAICELLKFPSIPAKVTINEYLEIAKEYSTPKSSIFINGILDNLVKEFDRDGKLKKAGRGLL